MTQLNFNLHPQLEADSITIGDFPLSRLLLINDSNYPWFVLVPRQSDISEIYQLSEQDQIQLTQESAFLSKQISELYDADKINIAALGNMVPQLHIHHIVRFTNDSSWPHPIWGRAPAKPYNDKQLSETLALLKRITSNLPA
ncbi:MAG: HIT family protein [Gammaproteobacteria bacterium]|nr:MAG: HIT family protein [Gammaproteobacteria bacterium]RLA24114.1 MAG: HIT family protein [Gammaproteobacteria bacterium]